MPVQSSDTSGSNDDNACHAGEIALFVIHETDYVCALANTALILILYMYSCKLVSASERSHTAFPITRYCNCKVQVSGCWFGPATARLYEALSHPGVSLFCQSAGGSVFTNTFIKQAMALKYYLCQWYAAYTVKLLILRSFANLIITLLSQISDHSANIGTDTAGQEK